MRRGGEAGHVHADLTDDGFGHPLVDARDGGQEVPLAGERGDHPVDLGGEALDGLLQVIEVSEDLADDDGVVVTEPGGQRRLQFGILRRSRP
jgi:hypothetical protein